MLENGRSPQAVIMVPGILEFSIGGPEDEFRRLVEDNTTSRLLGVLGEPHVNVLKLNLALDELAKKS
jgi:K+-transporting ATPase c subunit